MATDILYPEELPRFLVSGHSREILSAVRRSEMETGVARVRRCFSLPPQILNVSTELTQEHFDIFYDFHENTLDVGSLPFYILVAGSEFDSGLEYWEVTFSAPFSVTVQHGTHRYRVDAKLLTFGEALGIPPDIYFTSWLFPVPADEELSISTIPVSGYVVDWPNDLLDTVVVPVDGTLRDTLQTHTQLPELLNVAVIPFSGTLVNILQTYTFQLPEKLDVVSVTPVSGTLVQTLISHVVQLPENFDIDSVIPVSGTLV